jgi:hypothetical protein
VGEAGTPGVGLSGRPGSKHPKDKVLGNRTQAGTAPPEAPPRATGLHFYCASARTALLGGCGCGALGWLILGSGCVRECREVSGDRHPETGAPFIQREEESQLSVPSLPAPTPSRESFGFQLVGCQITLREGLRSWSFIKRPSTL